MKKHLPLLFAAILGSIFTLGGFALMQRKSNNGSPLVSFSEAGSGNAHFARFNGMNDSSAVLSFSYAAKKTVETVVHIKSTSHQPSNAYYGNDLFRQFFGDDFYGGQREQVKQGTGSGVIVSADGYIVTNAHVIQDADEVEVALNNSRSYKASVIGIDPSTDLALIKISAKDLPYITFTASAIEVGDWVLAVGNPFNLASTVTAGIVSAKARNINILKDRYAVESFIQTDAAVNPGNSGGALVNLRGELVGINSAIASPTGAYAGYSFAIPSDIVAKVVADLRAYGVVQRAYLGLQLVEMNSEAAEKLGISMNDGLYVDNFGTTSSAKEAGIEKGDIIQKINGEVVKTMPQLTEKIAAHRPGDKVKVTVLRDGKNFDYTVTLKNLKGNVDVVTKAVSDISNILGADFEDYKDSKMLKRYGLDGAVQVSTVNPGKLKQSGVRAGFIIFKANNQLVRNVDELNKIMKNAKEGIMLAGIYPGSGTVLYYAFGME